MIHFLKKNNNSINSCLFLVAMYFFEIITLKLFQFNLNIGFILFFIIVLNIFFFGNLTKKSTKIFALILALFLIINVVNGYSMPCEELHLKMILSSLAFFVVFVISFNIGLNTSQQIFDKYVVNTARFLLIFSILVLLIQFFLSDHSFFDFHGSYMQWSFEAQSFDAFNPRLNSLFSEPSVFGLKTIMLYLILFFSRNRFNFYICILSMIFILWFSFSASFLFLLLILLLLTLIKITHLYFKAFRLYLLLILTSFLIAFYIDKFDFISNHSPYIYSRISFLFDTSYMSLEYSGLVYIQSWLDAYGSLYKSFWLGSGFNQESCFPRYSSIILERASTEPYPISELIGGSVLFAKFLNEFGFIGFVLFLYLSFYQIRLIKENRHNLFVLRSSIAFFVLFAGAITRSNIYFQFILVPFFLGFQKNIVMNNSIFTKNKFLKLIRKTFK